MEEKVALAAPLHQMAQPPDPGPIDISVLVEQEHHKSEAIFTGRGYKPVRFIEHGTRLNQWEVKHEGMLALLKRAGFYYLSCLKRVQLDHALLNALVERWRRETQTFHLRYGEITILLKDVAILSGLRVDGSPVTGPADCRWDELCLELLGQQPAKVKGGAVSIAWLYETFHKIPEGADNRQIEYATRAYILYQLGCSLFPDPSGTRVHLRYLPLLRDFDLCGEMAWGAGALSHLYRELGKASMKGKTNCCAFLTLLQIWAWEHIHIGRPERLDVKAPLHDRPLGCRWNVPFKSRENVRSIDTEFYRHGLDTILDSQITWDPYNQYLMAVLPPFCTAGSAVWLSRVPLICFQVVEMHVPDRVLLQFGMIQHIPDPVEVVERVTMQGRSVEDWSTYHSKYIRRWADRLSTVVRQSETVDPDPTQARNHYFEWYWNITRRWISTPVERPTISFQSLGQSERAMVDLVMTVQRRIRRLLSGEVERKRLKENLAEIDAYISTELEKAKPSTSEVGRSYSRQKQKIRASSPRYLTRPTAIPLAVEAGIATRFIESVQHSPVMQALPIKADPDGEDNNHEEGNTILELDQMRSIEPVGIRLQEEAIDSSSKEAKEENGKVQENVNEPMEKINVRETANETIENDERMETISAAIEGDEVQDNPDIVMKDDEVRKSISTNMESAKELETIDEPVKAGKVQETLAVTIKDGKVNTVDSPMRTGEVKEGVDEYTGGGKMHETVSALMENDEIHKVVGESIEDGNVHEIIHASIEKDKVREIHGELMNDEKSETTEAHMEHVEEQEQVDEPMESSQVREEQETVDEPRESSKLREERERFDKPMETSNVSEDAKAQTENANISEKVGAPMEHDEIQEAHDGLMKDDEAHKTVEAHIKCVEEQEKVGEPMESSKVQDNVEAPTKNAKIEEKVGAPRKNKRFQATRCEVMKEDEVQETLEAHLAECVKEQERITETLENSKLLENVEAPAENARIKIAPTQNEEVRETTDGVMKDDEAGEAIEAHIKHSKSKEIGNEPNNNWNIKETLKLPIKRDKIKEIVADPTKKAAGACVGWSEVQKRSRSNRRKRKRFHVQSTF